MHFKTKEPNKLTMEAVVIIKTLVYVYVLLALSHGVLGENTCQGARKYVRIHVDTIASESTIATHKTRFHGECLFYCAQTPGCLSYNYQYSGNGEHLCELNNITLEACPAKLRPKEGHSYFVELLNDAALQPYGSHKNPAKTCLDIKRCGFEDGEYWMFYREQRILVYCFMNSNDETQINLALNKPTSQSSTAASGISHRAVDGNRNPNYRGGTCTHTHHSYSPWWRVDLQKVYMVRQVDITNRGDCCHERLANFSIRIGTSLIDNGNSNPSCGGNPVIGAGETKPIFCDAPLIGRYVNIVIPNQERALTLCEVEVYP